ncbi:transporter substrate-binding domain-containing protein [Pseudodesulfovibrio sp.]|nr:transporter substrate-binding domain-containing protein [Pseudodesulfovibrio sp.]
MPHFNYQHLVSAILVSCLFWAAVPSHAQSLDDLTYMTEEYYPFNYEENGEVTGISVEILHLTLQEIGMQPRHLELLPWARGYDRVQHEENTVLFSMARTKEREDLFQWAGPIMVVKFVLIAKKDRNINIESMDDIKGYSIGTVREDVADALLDDYKATARVEAVADMKHNIDKLMDNRLDMVAYEERSWQKIVSRNDLSTDDFKTVFILKETPVHYAFHKYVDQKLINEFQQALDTVKARPEYQQILDTYLK